MPSEKILIVDDDQNICELLRLYLDKEGYQTQIAHDGETAIATFESWRPGLVLLDVMMPKMDGWEVCRRIRALGMCRSSCSPPRARPLIRFWAWSWEPTIMW